MGRLPKMVSSNGLNMHSLFSRLNATGKIRDKTKSVYGDNSPYIYALKGLDGLSIRPDTIQEMLVVENRLLGIFKKHNPNFDTIIPAPSGHTIAHDLAHRVSSTFDNLPVYGDLLKKETIQGIFNQLDALSTDIAPNKAIQHIRKVAKIQLKNLDNDGSKNFAIKSIYTKYRKYISPVIVDELSLPQQNKPQRILLIDDQLSSGTTLISAYLALLAHYPNAKIEALTLFSCLFGRLSK